MQDKKVLLIALVFLGIELSGLQAQTMYLKTKSGVQTAFLLSNIKKLSFSSGNLSVKKTNGNIDTYTLSGIRYLNFTNLTLDLPIAGNRTEKIKLYPNPVNGSFVFLLYPTENHVVMIKILSIDGKTVYKEVINGQTELNKVNISTLPRGFYVLILNDGETIRTAKFVKQ